MNARDGLPCCEYEVATFAAGLGWMGVAASGGILQQVTFGHASAEQALASLPLPAFFTEQLSPATERLVCRLRDFAAGSEDDFQDVPLDLERLTPFARRVVDHCRRIAWGQTLSYGELAAIAGAPGAARAVGSVMAKNRFPLIVPCHRVIGSAGGLGGYSAAQGLSMKRRLLDREQLPVAVASSTGSQSPVALSL